MRYAISNRGRAERRKMWLNLHGCLGLTAGAVLALVGLTGGVLVFWQELDEGLNPGLRRVEATPGGGFAPLERIQAAAERALPEGAVFGFAYYPRHERATFQLFYDRPAAAGGVDHYRVFVDPYTARTTGTRLVQAATDPFPRSFLPFLFQLHYALLFRGGAVVVAVFAICLLVAVPVGLWLWWPSAGKWRPALTFKRGAGPERRNFDLHKLAGVYTAIPLVVVLVSGVSMNLPGYFRMLVACFSPPVALEPSLARSDGPPIGWGRAAAIFDADAPTGRLIWIQAPEDGAYQACKRLDGWQGYRCVWVDSATGVVLKRVDAVEGSAGDRFLQWQWPLHSGQAFGWPGRILVGLTGLACPVLYVTGFAHWRRKRHAIRRKLPVSQRFPFPKHRTH
ncbi:PepSY-associated TM helix domain-containing protein [Methylomagnum ishizawai]|nr:PepSY-associated TM helix domain-containing protein [Methylomagnum ishizawai]